jgi:hypothetical protein
LQETGDIKTQFDGSVYCGGVCIENSEAASDSVCFYREDENLLVDVGCLDRQRNKPLQIPQQCLCHTNNYNARSSQAKDKT